MIEKFPSLTKDDEFSPLINATTDQMLFSKLEFQSNSNSALTCRLAVRIRVCVAEPVGSAAALISALVRPATRAIDVRIRHRWPLQVNHFEQFNAPPVAISVKSFKKIFYE